MRDCRTCAAQRYLKILIRVMNSGEKLSVEINNRNCTVNVEQKQVSVYLCVYPPGGWGGGVGGGRTWGPPALTCLASALASSASLLSFLGLRRCFPAAWLGAARTAARRMNHWVTSETETPVRIREPGPASRRCGASVKREQRPWRHQGTHSMRRRQPCGSAAPTHDLAAAGQADMDVHPRR